MELTMKSLVTFEVKIEENVYTFAMPAGCPAGQAYDALTECLKKVVQVSNESVNALERSRASSEEKIEG